MSCKDCTQFMAFAENKGLKEVPGDGMCTKAGKDRSPMWIAVCYDHHCLNFRGDPSVPILDPAGIKPMNTPKSTPLRILEKAKMNSPLKIKDPPPQIAQPIAANKPGECLDCAFWQRRGFTDAGVCWKDNKNCGEVKANGGCQSFHPSPADNGKVGDIVDVIMGEQMQVIFIGNEMLICRNRDGKEKVFDKKGFKFRKC